MATPSPVKRISTPLEGDKGFTIPEKYTKDKEDGTDRFNDGACDALGRFWCVSLRWISYSFVLNLRRRVGTMGVQPENRKGQFYRYVYWRTRVRSANCYQV